MWRVRSANLGAVAGRALGLGQARSGAREGAVTRTTDGEGAAALGSMCMRRYLFLEIVMALRHLAPGYSAGKGRKAAYRSGESPWLFSMLRID